MSTASLILPFAVPIKEGAKTFTPSMELAAILLLTESQRKRRGFLDATPKRTLSVSKLHYPLWAVAWENRYLILDGLGVFSARVRSDTLPDIPRFIDDIERGALVREQFRSALEKHEKTFKDLLKTDEIQIDALIKDTELLSTIFEYVKESMSTDLGAKDSVVLAPPRVDREVAVESVKQLSSLCKRMQSQVRALEYARNLLGETLGLHEQMILKEVELTREAFEAEVSKFRPAVEKEVEQLLKERDARIAKMNRIMQNDLKARERERERRERELQRLEIGKAENLRRRETRKRKHDKIGEIRWQHRIKVYENRIEETKSRIHALSEFIEKTRRQGEADVERLRYGYQALIDQERRKIVDIEVERDRVVAVKQEEIEQLKVGASRIASQIEELSEQKRRQQDGLGNLAMPMQLDDVTLLCLPFYLASYQAGGKTRFQVFPPFSVKSSEGIVKTLKRTISLGSVSRLKLFLEPKSKVLSKMLHLVLDERMKSDKAFNESLLKAAASCNVLERRSLKDALTRGISELKAEGWINQSQGDALIKAYT